MIRYSFIALGLTLFMFGCASGGGGAGGQGGDGGAGGTGGVPENRCPIITRNLVSPLSQTVGNLIDVETTVVDAEGDEVEVVVISGCGEVTDQLQVADSETGESRTTVRCDEVKQCYVVVAVSDDGFDPDGCNGTTPDAASLNPINCQAQRP